MLIMIYYFFFTYFYCKMFYVSFGSIGNICELRDLSRRF